MLELYLAKNHLYKNEVFHEVVCTKYQWGIGDYAGSSNYES
jgi:hypothetical protein